MALLIQGITALGTWSEHNILPSTETEWIAEAWPWYVDCPPWFPSEVNLIRDSSTLGDGSFRYKIGVDFTGAEPLADFPTDQQIRVRWLEVERDGTNAIVSTVAKSEDFTLSQGDTGFISPSFYTTAIPSAGNTAGVEGPFTNPTISASIIHTAARSRKYGFPAYTLVENPPRYYTKETQTGYKPGCGDTPSEDYEGYVDQTSESSVIDNRTDDTETRGYYSDVLYLSELTDDPYPSIPPTSRTTCGKNLTFFCADDGELKEASITTTLSDEILTSEIEADVATGLAGGGTYFGDVESLAYDYLSPDERIKAECSAEWHLEGSGNLNDYATANYDVEATVTTYALPEGTSSTSTITETLTGYVGTTRNTSADPQTWQIIHGMTVTSSATTPAQYLSVEALTNATRIEH